MQPFNIERAPLFRWTITRVVSGDDVDFHFGHIEGEPRWLRKIPGRIAVDPCSGDRTLIRRTNGSTPLRRGKLTMHFGVENGNTPDENLQQALELFTNGGPFLLTMPTGRTINFVFDDESGEWEETTLTDRGYRVTVGVAEVQS